MTVSIFDRGRPAVLSPHDDLWRWLDTGAVAACSGGAERPCPKCGQTAEPGGADPCLGVLPGATSACCGHGVTEPWETS